MQFEKQILIYLPCYNCESSIAETLSGIPRELHGEIECLVIDNDSSDNTVGIVLHAIKRSEYPFKINVIRNKRNIEYAGSQKVAFSLALRSPEVKNVIVLHGDGQYSPSLLPKLLVNAGKDYAVVNVYRDKKAYPEDEETPFFAYYIIRFLSWLESAITGYQQKEWHSGFVMYSTDFLKKIPLHKLCKNMHIDGEFLICAGVLGEKTLAVPIYKRYKEYKAFKGLPRMKHIIDVFVIMFKYKRGYYHRMLRDKESGKIDFDFDVLA